MQDTAQDSQTEKTDLCSKNNKETDWQQCLLFKCKCIVDLNISHSSVLDQFIILNIM